jgi:PleD family two-component response regulator
VPLDEAVAEADRRLYCAKANGRNRVVSTAESVDDRHTA